MLLELRRERLGTTSVDCRRRLSRMMGCSRISGTALGDISGVAAGEKPRSSSWRVGWASRLVGVRCMSGGPWMVLWLRAGFTGGTVVWPWLPPRTGAEGSKGMVWAWAVAVKSKPARRREYFMVVGERGQKKPAASVRNSRLLTWYGAEPQKVTT